MSPLRTLPFSAGNDLTFEVYVPPAKNPATGLLEDYPGTTITGWIAASASPNTPLNGTIKTFTRTSPGRWLWSFDGAEVDACLSALSPAAVDGAQFVAGMEGAGQFKAFRRLSFEAVRLVP